MNAITTITDPHAPHREMTMNTTTATQAAPIAWHPLADMPADRKDGRDVLLWVEGRYPAVCSWLDGWRDGVGHPVFNVTDWADVEGPVP